MKPQSRFRQNTIALVYDFDGTLSPQPMQEYTVLPDLGLDPGTFWEDVEAEQRRCRGDRIITYMRLLLDRIEARKRHLSRDDFSALAGRIRYFAGVESWFERIDVYVRERSGGRAAVKHFIISAGLKEILDGITIGHHFSRIYASEYFYDHHGVARFPNVVINDTVKTQYLFRINKGREEQDESINEYMPEGERPVPFPNMIYIGDGMTDVPSMTVTKKNGGFAVAVYKPSETGAGDVCRTLYNAGRIDFFAPADYRQGRPLERRVRLMLDMVIARVLHAEAVHAFEAKLRRRDGK